MENVFVYKGKGITGDELMDLLTDSAQLRNMMREPEKTTEQKS